MAMADESRFYSKVFGLVAVALGTLLTAFVQGALVDLRFAFTGLPSPVVFGGLATFAAIGITLGPVVVALVLALVRFAEEGLAT